MRINARNTQRITRMADFFSATKPSEVLASYQAKTEC